MKKNIVLLTALLFNSCQSSSDSAPATDSPVPGNQDLSSKVIGINMNGIERRTTLFVPNSATARLPLLLVFHGGGGDSDGMAKVSDFNKLAAIEGFIVGYPQGVEKQWSDGRSTTNQSINDVLFIKKLIDKLVDENAVDRDRVFIAGISNGGLMTQKLACDLTSYFKGAATIAATMTKNTLNNCRPSKELSVLSIHGTKDKVIPYSGGEMPIGLKGKVASTAEVSALWKNNNNCTSQTIRNIKNRAFDGTTTKVFSRSCDGKTKVAHYKIENGGHTWPDSPVHQPVIILGLTSRDFNASSSIWNFFKGISH